jgi:hypothetical protein
MECTLPSLTRFGKQSVDTMKFMMDGGDTMISIFAYEMMVKGGCVPILVLAGAICAELKIDSQA